MAAKRIFDEEGYESLHGLTNIRMRVLELEHPAREPKWNDNVHQRIANGIVADDSKKEFFAASVNEFFEAMLLDDHDAIDHVVFVKPDQ